MKKFQKQIVIIYVLFIFSLLLGKFYIEIKSVDLFQSFFQPFSFFLLFILCFYLNRDFKDYAKKKRELLDSVLIVMMIYGIVYFLSGLFFTFVRSPYDHSLIGILKNIWRYVVIIFLQEYVRYTLIKYSGSKKRYFILIGILFLVLDINLLDVIDSFQSSVSLFQYFCSTFLVSLCHSFLANYLVLRGNYKVSIVYLFSLEIMTILLPAYPNLNWFFAMIYEVILTMILYGVTSDFMKRRY